MESNEISNPTARSPQPIELSTSQPVVDYCEPDSRSPLPRGIAFSPPGFVTNGAAVFWAVVCLWNATAISQPESVLILGWGIGVALGAFWFLKLLMVENIQPKVHSPSRWDRWRWRIVPVIALSVLVLTMFDIPLRLCFAISWPAFHSIAAKSLATHTPLPPQQIGAYFGREITGGPGQVRIITEDAGGIYTGFMYVRDGAPSASAPPVKSIWLGGGWYAFR